MSFIIQEQAAPVLFEIGKEEATGAGGTIDFYLNDQDFLYFEGNASANFAIDLAFDAATTLDDALNVDDLVTITLAVKNGSTPYVLTNFQIDGGAGTVTLDWQEGGPPLSGNPNEVDTYIFKILKTSGNAYTVFAALSSTLLINQPVNKQRIINSGISATSTIYLANEDILFYNATATSNFTLNATYATGISLNSVMATGDVKDCTFKAVLGVSASLIDIVIDGAPTSTNSIYFASAIPSATPNVLNEYNLQIAKKGDGAFDISVDKQNYTYPGISGLLPSVIEVLVVGGGGGGNSSGAAGAGGAGGFRSNAAFPVSSGTNYTVTIGAGGIQRANGNPSVFSTISSAGGGYGGVSVGDPGQPGGSGGGAHASSTGVFGTGNTPPTSPSQGNPGGVGEAFSGIGGGFGGTGGGGGGGAPGVPADAFGGGDGGIGVSSAITGTPTFYAGGGGGASTGQPVGAGGQGGGGPGSRPPFTPGTPGTVNTGGGGGGFLISSGNGGSGVVIIAQRSYEALPVIGAGLTYSVSTARAGYKVITFTAGSDTIRWG